METMGDHSAGVALVTGGGTGIGRAICLELARRGMDVCVSYRRSTQGAEETAARVRALGQRAVTVAADLTDGAQVSALMARVVQALGQLDLLVNNAGYTEYVPPHRLDLLSDEMVDSILAVNFKGAFSCAREAAALLQAGPGGHLVNIASTSGLDGKGSNIVYCAAKAALLSLTRSLAGALGPAVRVNAVCPGFVQTRFIEGVPAEVVDEDRARTPLGRLATPADVARAVAALHLDLTAVTGEALVVDGGRLVNG
jgi:3-oxoacyl-[acyl-carrier protein] reductase